MTNQLREVVADALLCPFCGSNDISDGEVLMEVNGKTFAQSECQGCGALGPRGETDGPDYGDERAIAAWNRRATLPTQSAGVEERARALEWVKQAAIGVQVETDEHVETIAAALRTPASEGDGGRVVATVCLRGDTYAHDLVTELQVQHEKGVTFPIGTKFYTTPPTQQEARVSDYDVWSWCDRHNFDAANIGNARDAFEDAAEITAALRAGTP